MSEIRLRKGAFAAAISSRKSGACSRVSVWSGLVELVALERRRVEWLRALRWRRRVEAEALLCRLAQRLESASANDE